MSLDRIAIAVALADPDVAAYIAEARADAAERAFIAGAAAEREACAALAEELASGLVRGASRVIAADIAAAIRKRGTP